LAMLSDPNTNTHTLAWFQLIATKHKTFS